MIASSTISMIVIDTVSDANSSLRTTGVGGWMVVEGDAAPLLPATR
jgi:hypothetical protein